MNIQRWMGRREADWQRLDGLLKQVERRGIRSLNASQVKEMASLYRSTAADLARARTQQVGHTVIKDLQSLTSRAYDQIYQGSRHQEWQGLIRFYQWEFPAIVQQTWVYTAIATALFFLSGCVAWWYAWQDPGFINLLLPESLISKVRDRGELWMGSIVGIEPLASTGIMTNNLKVAFAAVGGGISAGLFTVFILINNGLHIAAAAALVHQNNLSYPFWAFVFPHGSLELPAIFLAGGAGLLIARGLLFPGVYRRVDALRLYGSQAVQLVFGIVPMLVIAGVIEGFFSPSPLVPDALKYVVGMLLFLALIFYCRRQAPGTNNFAAGNLKQKI